MHWPHIFDFFSNAFDQLLARPNGPLHLRFVLQPTVAGLIAIRKARRDARENRTAYLSALLFHAPKRGHLVRDAWEDTGKAFIVACIVDVVYQLIELRWVYPLQTLMVAFGLAIVPYVVIRDLVTRLAKRSWHIGKHYRHA